MSLCLIPAGIEGYAFVDRILADVKCFCAVSVAVPTGEHIALLDGVVFNIDKLTVHNLLILYLRAAVRVESYRKTRMAYCKNYTGNKNNNTHEYKPIGGFYRYFDISVKPSRLSFCRKTHCAFFVIHGFTAFRFQHLLSAREIFTHIDSAGNKDYHTLDDVEHICGHGEEVESCKNYL